MLGRAPAPLPSPRPVAPSLPEEVHRRAAVRWAAPAARPAAAGLLRAGRPAAARPAARGAAGAGLPRRRAAGHDDLRPARRRSRRSTPATTPSLLEVAPGVQVRWAAAAVGRVLDGAPSPRAPTPRASELLTRARSSRLDRRPPAPTTGPLSVARPGSPSRGGMHVGRYLAALLAILAALYAVVLLAGPGSRPLSPRWRWTCRAAPASRCSPSPTTASRPRRSSSPPPSTSSGSASTAPGCPRPRSCCRARTSS